MSSDHPVLEFTVPFDLETCRQRIENRHEPFKFFAWDWQRRTHVSTRQTAPDTVTFTLKRVEKNDFISWGSLAVIRGAMRSMGAGHTVVVAQAQIVYFWIFAPLVFFLFALAGISLIDATDSTATLGDFVPMLGVYVLLMIVGMAVSWWWAHAQLRHLTGTLKEALGQWE